MKLASRCLVLIGTFFGITEPLARAGARDQAAAVMPLPDLSQKPIMNGIDPKSAAGFWDNWHLVTVRFRKDNNEQRFVYANDIAFAAFKANVKNFPDGSMFGKVAFKADTDPAFPNSMETSHFTRIQLMRKDSKAYAQTNGWGYSLYIADPVAQNEDDTTVMTACHACHMLVPERDFVFSRPTFIDAPGHHGSSGANAFADRFKLTASTTLGGYSKTVIDFFRVAAPQINYLSLPLFSGSLDESIAPLVAAASKQNVPQLLADDEHKRFLLARPLPPTKDCPANLVELMLDMMGHDRVRGPTTTSVPPTMVLRLGLACDGVIKWKSRPLPARLL